MTQFVYQFKEADGSRKDLFGGKGANLAEMTKLGMPVPRGFTITTEACTQYYADKETINDAISAEIMQNAELRIKNAFGENKGTVCRDGDTFEF